MRDQFENLLSEAKTLHDKKAHDYSNVDNPYGNYLFAGQLGSLFRDSRDIGFVTRIGEKLYRLANLENNHLSPKNESIADTELDLVVIITLWMASRRDRRLSEQASSGYSPTSSFMPDVEKTFYCEICRCQRSKDEKSKYNSICKHCVGLVDRLAPDNKTKE